MAWRRQKTSHCLINVGWPRTMSPYGVTRPQWDNQSLVLSHGLDLGWARGPAAADTSTFTHQPQPFFICNIVYYECTVATCNISLWNCSNAMHGWSILWVLMSCFPQDISNHNAELASVRSQMFMRWWHCRQLWIHWVRFWLVNVFWMKDL